MKTSNLWIGAISLFPEMFDALNVGISGRALSRGLASLHHFNPRDFTQDAHRTVDDRPFGGGPGMVMKPEPLVQAIAAAKAQAPSGTKVVYVSPQGKRFTQAMACEAKAAPGIILIAGRYEGIDQRVIDHHVEEEWSLGDFVLSGGELAAMAMIDSMLRLLPGSLGDAESAEQDSFMQGLLDHPHYTRPEVFEGQAVPETLRSGDHAAIAMWRKREALRQTARKRPDLLTDKTLTPEEETLLNEMKLGDSKNEHA